MLEKLGDRFSQVAEKYMPDPFVIALLLTALTFGLCLIFTDHSTSELAGFWYGKKGFWNPGGLAFALQMCLILVTGYALATTSIVRTVIQRLAEIPQSTAGAAWLVATVAVISGYINWGFALVVGALLAREVATQGEAREVAFHYPLLGAAGYMGLAVWHGGLSGSAPLKVAEEGHFFEAAIGVIPVSQTLFSPLNLTVAGTFIIGLPLLFRFLAPSDPEKIQTISQVVPDFSLKEWASEGEEEHQSDEATTFAQKFENSFFLTLVFATAGFAYVVYYFAVLGKNLDLNMIITIFFLAGFLLHGSPRKYVEAVTEGTRGCGGIILQFPFYFGIMGLMIQSGLGKMMAQGMISIANSTTYPLFTFVSAGLVNLFVPSGGGQWAVQGQIVLDTAKELGVSPSKAILAFSYGDQWTNLLQPFWALALLGITGLQARQIMGYCMAVMLLGGAFLLGILVVM